MEFEYCPNSLEVLECLWNFSIPSLSLTQSFLLVGHTLDPSVFFDRTYLTFKTLLKGLSHSDLPWDQSECQSESVGGLSLLFEERPFTTIQCPSGGNPLFLLCVGSSAKEVVYLVNTEETDYSFSFVEQSLHSEGHTGQLKVEPMSGSIPPKSRYACHHVCTLDSLWSSLAPSGLSRVS